MVERILDKKQLSKYDLSVGLFEKFNIKVYDLVPVRSVYMLHTDKGEKILKKVNYSLEDFKFISTAIDYIDKSFHRIIGFVPDVDGEKYTLWEKDIYCLMSMVEGRECDYYNPIELKIASKALAQLHKASEGFEYPLARRNIKEKIVERIEIKREEITFFKNLVKIFEGKSDFDQVFFSNVDYYIDQIDESIRILSQSNYEEMLKDKEKIALCHHDLAYHNILINNEQAYFVDFDYSVIDFRTHDLSNFILKAIKKSGFEFLKVKAIIEDYNTVNNLDKDEIKMIYGFLMFPEDFYSISKDYYTKRKSWDERIFIERLNKKINYREDREEFLEQFRQEFNIK